MAGTHRLHRGSQALRKPASGQKGKAFEAFPFHATISLDFLDLPEK